MKVLTQILSIAVLVMLPLFTVWWFFVPLAILAIFLYRKLYVSLIAGFMLDTIYFASGHRSAPLFVVICFLLAALYIVLKDKLRLGNTN